LVRTFEDPDVVHVDGKVDPVADAEAINLELIYADLAHAERRLEKTTCVDTERITLERIVEGLERGIPARSLALPNEELFLIKSMGLLTLKPVLYVFNVDEVDFAYREQAMTAAESFLKSIQYCDPGIDLYTLVSAKLEEGITRKDSKQEQQDYLLDDMGIELEDGESIEDLLSYNKLPRLVLDLLDLRVVYTGPGVPPERSQTTKAYLLSNQQMTAEGLAGRLHGEIQKGFIRAEVTKASDLLIHEHYAAAKEAGCVRTEGRDYVLTADDVVLIKWK
jgi:ribosome-binding ATPase YchF (GTP1/OBG family)